MVSLVYWHGDGLVSVLAWRLACLNFNHHDRSQHGLLHFTHKGGDGGEMEGVVRGAVERVGRYVALRSAKWC